MMKKLFLVLTTAVTLTTANLALAEGEVNGGAPVVDGFANAKIVNPASQAQQPAVITSDNSSWSSPSSPAPATTQTVVTDTADSNLPLEQRVAKLERQINQLNNVDIYSRLQEAQNQIQLLQGQLEVEKHTVETLQKQQQQFYADLDGRLTQLSGGKTAVATASPQQPLTPSKVIAPVSDNAATNNNEAKQAYDQAYQELINKKYKSALNLMEAITKTYPDTEYAANAYYWLGQLYVLNGDSDKAITALNTVITQYKNNPKVPDAMFKLATIYYDEGNVSQAENLLNQITKNYSGTPSAHLASTKLKEINKT